MYTPDAKKCVEQVNMSLISSLSKRNNLKEQALLDPVNKFRVSTPQTLIDTDFEYGLQPTKWETIEVVNNIPTFFYRNGDETVPVSDVTILNESFNVTVITSSPHGFVLGSPIIIFGLNSITAEGSFIVNSVVSSTQFTYKAKQKQTRNASIFDIYSTYLYAARIFQGTQFGIDNIISMETDNNPLSKITVTTRFPHGFNIGTALVLGNSVGRKTIAFDGTLVDPLDTLTKTIAINTAATNPDGSGFTSRSVIPYDWQSKKTVFFNPNNVDTANSFITINNHNLQTNNTVMYVPPVGDTSVGGLLPYELYNVVAVNTNNIYLTQITATQGNGLYWRLVRPDVAENPNAFENYAVTSQGVVTDIYSIRHIWGAGYNLVSQDQYSVEYFGWFRANATGTWTFFTASDDWSYLWLGSNAIRGFTTANALVRNPGYHAVIEASATISLVANQYYPIRIQFAEGGGGDDLIVSFSGPGVAKRTNGNGFYFYENVPYNISGTKITLTSGATNTFGQHALLKSYLVSGVTLSTSLTINMNSTNNFDANLLANDPVCIFSGDATQAKDGHGIMPFVPSTNNISSSLYTRYFVSGTPSVGATTSSIALSASPGGSVINMRMTYINGVTWVVPLSTIAEYDSFYSQNHGISTNDPLVYSVTSGSGPTGLTNGTTYFAERVNNNFFRIKTASGASPTIDISTMGGGSIQFTQTYSNPTANTIYAPNHDMTSFTQVVYNNNGNVSIPGLTNGATYFIFDVNTDRFKLASSISPSIVQVNITGLGTNISTSQLHQIISTDRATDGSYTMNNVVDDYNFTLDAGFLIPVADLSINPKANLIMNSNMFFYPFHRMLTGARTKYINNGNTSLGGLTHSNDYYVIRNDLNHFQLASTYSNAIAGSNIPVTSLGTGANHSFYMFNVCGEVQGTSNVSLTVGSNLVSASNVDFLSTLRVSDTVRFQYAATSNSFNVTGVDGANSILTLNASHGLSDGNYVYYTTSSTAISALSNNFIYYVRTTGVSSTQVRVYETYSNAINNVSAMPVSGAATGQIIVRGPATVFSSIVTQLKSANVLTLSNNAPASASNAVFISTTSLYPRSDGYILHRPFDGGVEIIPSNNPDSQIIRQTRKYFRYQSGKGIQVSKAVNFSAPTDVDRLSRSSNIATINTRRPHRLKEGVPITVFGVDQTVSGSNYWNGVYNVSSVPSVDSFTISLSNIPPETTATGFPSFYVNSWVNSVLRAGLFDDQNGLFFEYDGQYLYAVRRSSIKQLPGTCAVTFGSSLITSTNTTYKSQLVKGDRIVIKGQTYKVTYVANDTSFYIQPPYRGTSALSVVITKTIDTKTPQASWSIDPCDGTGPTGINLDIHKIQMVYIDYSWYGAGKVRYGIKDKLGEVRYVHEYIHNNNFTEAYLRSGNLPGRYEVATIGVPTYVPALMHWGTSIIMDGRFDDDKAYLFTAAGIQLTYSGADQTTFTAATNSATLVNPVPGTSVAGFRITTTLYTAVQNIRSGTLVTGNGIATNTRTVGTASRVGTTAQGYVYLDRNIIAGGTATETITAGDPAETIPSFIPLVSIRLAPSVDNGRPGALGSREIVNRMQLILKSIGILTTNDVEIKLSLNGYPFSKAWERVPPPSLSQLIYHQKGDAIAGGTQIFSFRVSGGTTDSTGKRLSNNTTVSLEELATLGNSIVAGDDVFPNGPDLLTIGATILDTSGITTTSPFNIAGRITWTESQA